MPRLNVVPDLEAHRSGLLPSVCPRRKVPVTRGECGVATTKRSNVCRLLSAAASKWPCLLRSNRAHH